jgi:hypothetical protein
MKTRRLSHSSAALLVLIMTSAAQLSPAAAQTKPKPQATPTPLERGIGLKQQTPVKELPGSAKRFALVVGVDKYADTQITTLGGASRDARSLANALVTYAGFPADQVILLASDQPSERLPTRGNILRRFSNLAGAVPADGLLLFAFAGHGMERNGQAFLLPSDAQASDDVSLLEQTAINVSNVKDWVKRTGVRQVLLILDACRNDPSGRANADNPLTETYKRGFDFDVRNREVEAFATIYATAVGRRAFEYKEKKQGYFTWMLVEGLRGDAANERSEVTLASLVRYLQERVPKQVLLDLGPGKEQKPFAVIEGYKADDLVLAYFTKKVDQAPLQSTPPGDRPPAEETGIDSGGLETFSGSELEGTVWSGATAAGPYTIEFLKAGRALYVITSMRSGKEMQFVTESRWLQSGKVVQIRVGTYSVMNGTVDGDVMKGEGSNVEGVEWKWTMFKKPK